MHTDTDGQNISLRVQSEDGLVRSVMLEHNQRGLMSDTTAMEPIELNAILASRDPLALDCIASRIGGLNPFNISYLKHAAERRIGESDYNRIQIRGTSLDDVIRTWETELAVRLTTNIGSS
jgi:hypothetical protein